MINSLLVFAALQLPLYHVSTANVTVYYPTNMGESIAKNYLSAIDQIYLADTTKFKISSEMELRVRLCSYAYEFFDLTGSDSIFSPLWKDGTLYVLNRGDLNDPDYRSALEAGAIRALLSKLRQNGAPWWLINSAAVYESGENKNCMSPPIENVEYFADLDERIQNASSSTELSSLCFYLGETGKFFDLRFGVGALLQLVREFQHETNIGDAVKKLFNVDRAQLESDWRDFLKKEAESK
jgi:hypothetical protein